MEVRELRASDIVPLDAMLRVAYVGSSSWTERLESYLDVPRIASFVAELDDQPGWPVGCVFAVDYETVAYVSMMGVDAAKQRRGIARALFTAMLAWGEPRRLPWLLDATPMGAPLYQAFGFVDDGETIVFAGTSPAVPVTPRDEIRRATLADLDAIAALDRRAFGADRRWQLAAQIADPRNVSLAGPAGSLAVVRLGDVIGPILAPDAHAAAAVLDAALAIVPGTPRRIHVPSANPAAADLVRSRGFTESRRLRHMRHGSPPADEPALLWSRISLGEG
ncbi:MAG: GNAT family N-acetyltransferase [Vulcanimicrobiaceae bacterium]